MWRVFARERGVTRPENATEAVVMALAAALQVEPMEIEPPVGTVIDLESLDRLLETPNTWVTFEYDGLGVAISSTLDVEVTLGE